MGTYMRNPRYTPGVLRALLSLSPCEMAGLRPRLDNDHTYASVWSFGGYWTQNPILVAYRRRVLLNGGIGTSTTWHLSGGGKA